MRRIFATMVASAALLAAPTVLAQAPTPPPAADDEGADASVEGDAPERVAAVPGAVDAPTESVSEEADLEEQDEETPFRGSTFTYRNAVATLSFDPGAELTYNPTWVMAFELSPRYWFNKSISVFGRVDLTREITDDDSSTFDKETFLSDVSLGVSASRWARIPVVDIDLSSSLTFVLPTSKASQADTLNFAVAPALRVARTWTDVLAGFEIGYGLRVAKYFHRFTTSELESPVVGGCFAGAGCDRFLNTGVRNVSWRVSNSFDASLDFASWIGISASFGIITDFLYDDFRVEDTTLDQEDPPSTRHALVYDIGANVRPTDWFAVAIGASTINPQQAPDSSNYTAFFNRYTAVYLDLRFDVARLVAAATAD